LQVHPIEVRFLELTHTEAATSLGLYIAQAQTTKGDRVHTRQRTPPKPPLVAPRRVKGHFLARRARIQKRFARPRLSMSCNERGNSRQAQLQVQTPEVRFLQLKHTEAATHALQVPRSLPWL